MSAPVDVLAVLDAAISGVVNDPIRERRWHRENLIEVRVAVVELIEATRAAITEEGVSQNGLNRLRDAFARVGGEK